MRALLPGGAARATLALYAAQAAVSALVLAALPPLRDLPLRIPITYERDGLFLTILAKTIGEEGLFHASRFGAPFGCEIVDWPIGMWLPFGLMAGLARLSGEPGLAVNLYWLATIVVAGLSALYALGRLGLSRPLAFVLGILYAFQPYAFYRNVEHVNLAFPFVPLLALLLLRVAGVRAETGEGRERALTSLACVAQGFSYVYYSAFACILLAAAAPVGWLRTRSLRPLREGALAAALLAGSTAVTLAPSLIHWQRHGYNPDLDYKPPKETEVYALKLRYLLTPIPDHPLPPLRALARRIDDAFPGEPEGGLSRLGATGSLGLLLVLVFLVARAAGLLPRRDEPLDGAAALTLVTLLWSSVGGLATFLSVFVLPDIRAYARIVVFLSFFAVLAAGTALTRAARRLPLPVRLRAPARWLGCALLLAGGLADQVPVDHLRRIRWGSNAAFDEERSFVRLLEARLPAGAMVFQLPHMTVPVDRETHPPMLYYDPGRAYFHSQTLRWSWGAMIGRHHDWGRAVDALPVPEKVRTLAIAGFSGIWIDRWGYTGDPRPPYQELERELQALTGQPQVQSSRGRYSFLSLMPYRERLETEQGGPTLEHARRELLADMPITIGREGCGRETASEQGFWRACGPQAVLVLRNWRPGDILVTVAARIRSADASSSRIRLIGPEFERQLSLGPEPASIEQAFRLQGGQSTSIVLRREGSVACRETSRCFELADVRLATRRVVRGMPVNASGGLAVRTKY